jgi:hypothetical protein
MSKEDKQKMMKELLVDVLTAQQSIAGEQKK